MNKKYTAVIGALVAVLLPLSAMAATISSEGFETGDFSSWSSVGANWTIDSTEKHSGDHSAKVGGVLSDSSYVEKTVSTTGFSNIHISYWSKALAGLTDVDPADEVFLEWRPNSESAWHLVHTIDQSSADVEWHSNLPDHVIALPAEANDLPGLQIQFGAKLKDASNIVYIDDIEITGDAIPVVTPPTPPVAPDPAPVPPPTPAPTPGGETPPPAPGLDTDGDSILDAVDNCKLIPNFDQADADANGIGDACDNVPETTLALCSDGIDNDHNGKTDIADEGCVTFRPSITITKNIINNIPGKSFVDFLYHWTVGLFANDFSVPTGTTSLTYPFGGLFSITEYATPGYATTYSAGCTGTLAVNTNSNCVITNDGSGTGGGTGDGNGDIGDPVGTENTLALCTDGFDNNDNGLVDAADPSCAAFQGQGSTGGEGSGSTPPPAPPAPTPAASGTGGSSGGSVSFDYWGCTNKSATNFNSLANKDDGSCAGVPAAAGGSVGTDASTSTGEVLGASTTAPELSLPAGCTEYIHSYMGKNKKNDAGEVKLLQTFLNDNMGANIPVNGFFGTITKNWVKKFQVKNHDLIIKPWYDAGYKGRDIENGTGYVYKTTKYEINLMKCSELKAPLPDLTPDL